MSKLRDRSNRLKTKSKSKLFLVVGVFSLLVSPVVVPSAAATGSVPTATMYLDQPFVEGSYVAEQHPAETHLTTFDDQNAGYPGDTCSFTGATVDSVMYPAQDCHVYPHTIFGGASSISSSPTVGQDQNLTNYAGVGGGGISITFDTPQTYFGMWWSAGSIGNQVQLQSGADVVASVTADDVQNTISQTSSLNSLNGDVYASRFYLGNPYGWNTIGTPTDFSDQDPDNTYENSGNVDPYEAFVFIHFIAAPGTTFDRVNMIAPGNGFEFDNFTTSTSTDLSANVSSNLVLQRQIYAPNYVDFDANGGVGSVPRQYSVDNAAGYLQSNCLNYSDPTQCISAPNNSYSSYINSWNTSPDGTGDSYDTGSLYPFTSSQTLYAQWKTYFAFMNTTNSDFNAANVWDYADYDSEYFDYLDNLSDLTLPSPVRADQYLEGWYAFDLDSNQLHRVGGPGDVIPASSYTSYDYYYFARWVDNPPPPPPPPSVDAITPQVLLVYPKSSSVILPNMPLLNDSTASICLAESDSSGNPISSALNFTDRFTAVSGESSSFTISSSGPLLATTSRYLKISISQSSDTSCIGGTFHVVELRLLGAELTNRLPIFLTSR